MKFVEAFDLMKVDSRVQRENWPEGHYIRIDKSKGVKNYYIVDEKGQRFNMCFYNLIAEDWILVESPRRTLSDEINHWGGGNENINAKKVISAVKEIRDFLFFKDKVTTAEVDKKIVEVVGERLLK